LTGKKPAFQNGHFCFDRVNRLYVSSFVQILVFTPTVDPSFRRGSDDTKRVDKLQEVHKTPTYRPMGLIRQRNKGSGEGGESESHSTGRFLQFFNKNNAISGIFEL